MNLFLYVLGEGTHYDQAMKELNTAENIRRYEAELNAVRYI